MKRSFAILCGLVASAAAGSIERRQSSSNTATIDLSVNKGTPKNLAAGVLYGIPGGFSGMTPSQIPDALYSNWNYYRIGGAQMSDGGWITGTAGYKARFQNALSDYKTARKFGAKVILLPHDLFGTDHMNSGSVWPGDNNNWTNYDQFLDTLLSDIKSNNMLDGLVFDTWNEPDGSFFWARSQAQYLQLWSRTYKRIRGDASLNSMLISGPSSANRPSASWYATWLQYAVQNNAVPDQYSWHDEPGDPQSDYAAHNSALAKYGAPTRPININEYGSFAQQVAAGSAWYISRLERINANGLRGNWLSGCHLHDFLSSLLTKSDTNSCGGSSYSPNGDWQTYQYYSHNMSTGYRAGTTGTGDNAMDVFATVGSDKVRVLTGVIGSRTGTWYITIKKLSAIGLPTSGTLQITTYGLIDKGHNGAVGAPTTSSRGVAGHQYSGDSVTFPVYQTQQDLNTAWIFEFAA